MRRFTFITLVTQAHVDGRMDKALNFEGEPDITQRLLN